LSRAVHRSCGFAGIEIAMQRGMKKRQKRVSGKYQVKSISLSSLSLSLSLAKHENLRISPLFFENDNETRSKFAAKLIDD